jgi:two-component system OmpR family response regulator
MGAGLKVLLLEDDAVMTQQVSRRLVEDGHLVECFDNGLDAFQQALGAPYDVLILDRMVPGADGLTVVDRLRAAGVNTPVLFLTAVAGVEERVAGLEAGADDYLVKPFEPIELEARIRALARRSRQPGRTVLVVEDLELDTVRRMVRRAGREIRLQPQEFKLLEHMCRNSGQVLTRAMLLEQVWGFRFDPGTNIVESHMSRLRAKIDRGFAVRLIETIRGLGYRFAPST